MRALWVLVAMSVLMSGCAGMGGQQGPDMKSVPADSIVFERTPFIISAFRLRELYVLNRVAPAAKCEKDQARNTPACVKFRAMDEEAQAIWARIEAKILAPSPVISTQQQFDVAKFAEVLGMILGVAGGLVL